MGFRDFSDQVSMLYERELSSLKGFAHSRVPDTYDPTDTVQDAFVDILEQGSLEGIKSPGGHAMTIVHRRAMDEIRKKYRNKEILTDGPPAEACGAPDPAEVLEGKERARKIWRAVRRLPAQAQRFVYLDSIGYRPLEIAEMESTADKPIEPKHVSWTLYEARSFLRRELGPRSALSVGWIPWTARLRLHFETTLRKVGGLMGRGPAFLQMIDNAALLPVAILILVAGPVSSAAGHRIPEQRGSLEVSVLSPETTSGAFSGGPTSPEGVSSTTAETGSLGSVSGSPEGQSASPGASKGGETIGGLPPPDAPKPPQSPSELTVETPNGGKAEYKHWQEGGGQPPPSLLDQTRAIAGGETSIPLPHCSGLDVCEEIPQEATVPSP